jgi:hypothetical protein
MRRKESNAVVVLPTDLKSMKKGIPFQAILSFRVHKSFDSGQGATKLTLSGLDSTTILNYGVNCTTPLMIGRTV